MCHKRMHEVNLAELMTFSYQFGCYELDRRNLFKASRNANVPSIFRPHAVCAILPSIISNSESQEDTPSFLGL